MTNLIGLGLQHSVPPASGSDVTSHTLQRNDCVHRFLQTTMTFHFYHRRMPLRRANAFGGIRLSVCLSVLVVCVSGCLKCSNFWTSWPKKFIVGTWVHLLNFQVKFVHQGHRVKVKVTGAERKRKISSHHPSVIDIAAVSLQLQWPQVHFISVIRDMTLAVCSRARSRTQAARADFKLLIIISRPAGRVCGLQISDPQTVHVMVTERVCVSCSKMICLQLKGNVVLQWIRIAATMNQTYFHRT